MGLVAASLATTLPEAWHQHFWQGAWQWVWQRGGGGAEYLWQTVCDLNISHLEQPVLKNVCQIPCSMSTIRPHHLGVRSTIVAFFHTNWQATIN